MLHRIDRRTGGVGKARQCTDDDYVFGVIDVYDALFENSPEPVIDIRFKCSCRNSISVFPVFRQGLLQPQLFYIPGNRRVSLLSVGAQPLSQFLLRLYDFLAEDLKDQFVPHRFHMISPSCEIYI